MKNAFIEIISKIKQREFLALVAAIVFAIHEAQLLHGTWEKLLLVAVSVFGALGYGVARTVRKNIKDKKEKNICFV